MDSDRTEIFIVRVWPEAREIEGAKTLWRAVIEHVSSGNRLYLEDLDEIPAYIARFLQAGA